MHLAFLSASRIPLPSHRPTLALASARRRDLACIFLQEEKDRGGKDASDAQGARPFCDRAPLFQRRSPGGTKPPSIRSRLRRRRRDRSHASRAIPCSSVPSCRQLRKGAGNRSLSVLWHLILMQLMFRRLEGGVAKLMDFQKRLRARFCVRQLTQFEALRTQPCVDTDYQLQNSELCDARRTFRGAFGGSCICVFSVSACIRILRDPCRFFPPCGWIPSLGKAAAPRRMRAFCDMPHPAM